MAKKMRKMIAKNDLDNNPEPTKKNRKERIPPSSTMNIPRAVFGSDIIAKREKGVKDGK